MLWTVVSADLLYTVLTLPLLFGFQFGIAMWQKRAQRIQDAKNNALWDARRAVTRRRRRPLLGSKRRRKVVFEVIG
jgi:hypothetical protein